MSDHRTEERAAILPQLRIQAQNLVELAAAAKIMIAQLELWSGPKLEDFINSENDTNAQPRFDETLAAISATKYLINKLADPTPNFTDITIENAILRIAKR